MTSNSYELGRHADRCAFSGDALGPGDRYIACLVERDGEDGLDRVDVGLPAWEAGRRPDRLFAFWTARIAQPDEKPRLFVDDDSLIGIFDQLASADDPKRLAFRYVLALVLVRKRLIRQVGTRPAKGDTPAAMLVKRRGAPDEEPEPVVDPSLDAQTIAEVTAQLGTILNPEA